MERMNHYWVFMSIHSSKFGKDASLLGLHVIHSSKYGNCITLFIFIHSSNGKDASLLGLLVHTLQ